MISNNYTFEIRYYSWDIRVLRAIFEEDPPSAGARALKLNWVSPVSNWLFKIRESEAAKLSSQNCGLYALVWLKYSTASCLFGTR